MDSIGRKVNQTTEPRWSRLRSESRVSWGRNKYVNTTGCPFTITVEFARVTVTEFGKEYGGRRTSKKRAVLLLTGWIPESVTAVIVSHVVSHPDESRSTAAEKVIGCSCRVARTSTSVTSPGRMFTAVENRNLWSFIATEY